MKNITITLIVIITLMTSFTVKNSDAGNSNFDMANSQSNDVVAYQLFPTENVWTFIKLNTRNGQMWQVQFDVLGTNRFETILNAESLVTKDKEVNGRFTLYATQNRWTFILLDQIDGKNWQVQWSIEEKERLVIPID